ncbi:MAG: hypothetical protein IKR57_02280 [Bacilli bacterium]|nr:hypothetical protein [Bacilli bacterium]
MKHENVIDELNAIMLNIPEGLEPIEKVRYLYIKIGEVFSYDYDYLDNMDTYKVRFEDDYVDRFSTCKEISSIFALMANNIDKDNIKCEVVENPRRRVRGDENQNHVSNIVELSTGERFVLDLTLDLHLIQSGCQTMEFGYTTLNGDEDIISLRECEMMDKKMGLIKNGEYTDTKINKDVSEISHIDFSGMSFEERINILINHVNKFMVKFRGVHEGRNYIKTLISRMVRCNYKDFTLRDYDNNIKVIYLLDDNMGDQVWYEYDKNKGLIKTSVEEIKKLLQSGWSTRSMSLEDILDEGIMSL